MGPWYLNIVKALSNAFAGVLGAVFPTISAENTEKQLNAHITMRFFLVLIFLTVLILTLVTVNLSGNPSFWRILGDTVLPN